MQKAKQLVRSSSEKGFREIHNELRNNGHFPMFAGDIALKGTHVCAATAERNSSSEVRIGIPEAYAGYLTALDRWNKVAVPKAERYTSATPTRMRRELADWLDADKLKYVSQVHRADPSIFFRLNAAPNVWPSTKGLKTFAQDFGKRQPERTEFHVGLEQFSPDDLFGTDPGNGDAFVFSLIANKTDKWLEGRSDRQHDKFTKLQEQYPFLKVPSVYESVVYAHTLRAHRFKFLGQQAIEATYVGHIDLPDLKGLPYEGSVLSTYVSHAGKLSFDEGMTQFAVLPNNARVAVG